MRRRVFLISGTAAIGMATGMANMNRSMANSQPMIDSAVTNTEDVFRLEDGVRWMDVAKLPVEGRAWNDEPRYRTFDRLPIRAEKIVTPAVWGNSRHSSGMLFRFIAETPEIRIQYRLMSENLAMPNMTAAGVSGVDLYADRGDGRFLWCGNILPTQPEISTTLISGIASGRREYRLYFPLYNGVESMELGVPDDAVLEPLPPRDEKPILFYGTSILHGGCAARPGMVWTSILARRLNQPSLNFGFSGSAQMESPLAKLVAELDPSVFVLDPVPNMDPPMVRERAVPFIRILREAHPETPIIFIEDHVFEQSWLIPQMAEFHVENHRACREAYEQLQRDGVKKLYYIEGNTLYGDDHEGAVDGDHATDLGFYRQAAIVEPVLREALGLEK